MASRSVSVVATDSSGIQASEEAQVYRLEGTSTLNQTINTLDGNAIAGAFGFAGDALKNAGRLQGEAMTATRQTALATTEELANAYRDARGATSGNAMLAVVVMIVLAAAAMLIKGR